ncbi:hypothetical protein EOD39_16519 [Acipenser ruthenus]|uniref:Uncharacterized protein n=1 Tax=Acipenser ruthenus TaxID=7906 RepID=A0A444V5Q7_ACIRT|nr:hypothetical protein EOD39_16519 [Acipenser ruthenus]
MPVDLRMERQLAAEELSRQPQTLGQAIWKPQPPPKAGKQPAMPEQGEVRQGAVKGLGTDWGRGALEPNYANYRCFNCHIAKQCPTPEKMECNVGNGICGSIVVPGSPTGVSPYVTKRGGESNGSVPEAGEVGTATAVPEAGEVEKARVVLEAGELGTATAALEAEEVEAATAVCEAGEVGKAMVVPEAGEVGTATAVRETADMATARTVPEDGEMWTAMALSEAGKVEKARVVLEAEELVTLFEQYCRGAVILHIG